VGRGPSPSSVEPIYVIEGEGGLVGNVDWARPAWIYEDALLFLGPSPRPTPKLSFKLE